MFCILRWLIIKEVRTDRDGGGYSVARLPKFQAKAFYLFIRGGIRCLLGLELLGKNRQSGLACRPNQQRGVGISEAEFVHLNSVLRCPVKEPVSVQKVFVVGSGGEPLGKQSSNSSRKLAARN